MKMRMNVYLTTAKRVLCFAYPTILSLFRNNQEQEIFLYLVSEDLTEEDISEECKLAEEYHNHIIILHFDEEMAKERIVSGNSEHWPIGTLGCYWLFHSLLPSDVERIMAIEADTIITGSLYEFYSTDLNGFYAACPDANHKPTSHRNLMTKLHGDVLSFVVSVYDVKSIQRDFSLEQILDTDNYVVSHYGHSQQELTFGILFQDKIKYLPAGCLCIEENRQSMRELGFDYLLECEEKCSILHFSSYTDKEKPWNPVSIMPGYLKWWEYAKESPYFKQYFVEQWKTRDKQVEAVKQISKNVTHRNILGMMLVMLIIFLTLSGLILGQSFHWYIAILASFIGGTVFTLLLRHILIVGQKKR